MSGVKGKSGVYPGNKGRSVSSETKRKYRLTIKRLKRSGWKNAGWFEKGNIPIYKSHPELAPKGKDNRNWKGDNVGYSGLHYWIARKLGKSMKCEHCGKDGLTGQKIHWANKSRKYKRELTDWIRLCAKCHAKYDNLKGRPKIYRENCKACGSKLDGSSHVYCKKDINIKNILRKQKHE